jgi:hypothetical protein
VNKKLSEIIKFNTQFFNLEEINPLISRYKCYIAYADEPANKFIFSKEVLENMKDSIKGAPVLTYYSEDDDTFGGHEDDVYIGKNGLKKRTPEPKAIGFTAYDIEPFWEYHEGKEFLTTYVYFWKARYPELNTLENRDIYQSMEVWLDADDEGEYKVVKDAILTGLVLISVNPAFTGSTFEKFSINNNDFKNEVELLKKEYESIKNSKSQDDITNFPTQGDNKKISLRNSNYPLFDVEYAKNLKENYPQIWKKGGNIRGNEAFNYALKSLKGDESEGVLSWIKEREAWAARHHKDLRLAGVVANVKWLTIVAKGESYMKDLINDEKKKYNKDSEKLSESTKEQNDYVSILNYVDGTVDDLIPNNLTTGKKGLNIALEKNVKKEDEQMADINIDEKDKKIDEEIDETKKMASDTAGDKLEEKNETSNEEAKEDENKENMSDETMDYKAMYEDMCGKYSTLETDFNSYKSEMSNKVEEMSNENTNLKEFKENVEKQVKQSKIEFSINSVSDDLTQEHIDEWRKKSESFSNADEFDNAIKAFAYSVAKSKLGSNETNEFARIHIPKIDENSNKNKSKSGLWN